MVYQQLKELRDSNGIKQVEIAKFLGVSQNTYSQYENGIIPMTDETLIKIADYFQVSVDFLLERTKDKRLHL